MTNILIVLLLDFFEGAFGITDTLFSGFIWNSVFFVENELAQGSTAISSDLISTMYNIVVGFSVAILLAKFLKKILETYILEIDGDAEASPEGSVKGYVYALIMMLTFQTLYGIFAEISSDMIVSISEASHLPIEITLLDLLTNFTSSGLFTLLGLLIFFICYLIILFQFMTRGLEMLVLRVGFPFACIGLVDSDKGGFGGYIKKFLQNTFTIMVQLVMLKLGLDIFKNGNMFWGLAAMIMGVKAPRFIQEFMLGASGMGGAGGLVKSGARGVSSMIRTVKMVAK